VQIYINFLIHIQKKFIFVKKNMEKKIRPTLIGGQNKLFYLDAETIESIETLAKARKVSGSQIVREAIKTFRTNE
jgi:hypothetical protein